MIWFMVSVFVYPFENGVPFFMHKKA